ncbi:unnamed protein product [Eruca vesicaria subsp. sativa]|uniref:F-box domain-containing protein n=1 Tax=Eruca vesicaria subsp. sativa TaxID=29727 RepID=A0ABC8LSD6_ERUVS|nr:unnamed protein product [Eruca vesicaria subsp. sativa]
MMVTCSKKKKLKKGRKRNFVEIPQNLVKEIIKRLPVKSVARFLLVSKSWANLITGQDFIRSFPTRSCSSQPRVLVSIIGRTTSCKRQYCCFFSSSSTSTTFLSRVECPHEDPENFFYHPHYANGLIRLGCGTQKIICNPSTGKPITLPRVESIKRVSKSLFGYDPVNDAYKILCMTKNRVMKCNSPSYEYQYQVLTLGAEQSSWRKIECSIPHRYCSNAYVCIDGVVYYVGSTINRTGSDWGLMKFDLRYEKFDRLTSLSSDMARLGDDCVLINYKGKVAIAANARGNTFNVWVIDQDADPKHGWLKKSFCTESWKSSSKLFIYGSTRTGEFVLAPRFYSDDFNVMLYNPNTDGLRKIKVDVKEGNEFKYFRRTRVMVFPEYVESIRLL